MPRRARKLYFDCFQLQIGNSINLPPLTECAENGRSLSLRRGRATELVCRAPGPVAVTKDARAETDLFGVEVAARFYFGSPVSIRKAHGPVLENLEHHATDALKDLSRAVIEGRTEPLQGVLVSQLLKQSPACGATARVVHDAQAAAPQGRSAAHFNCLPVLEARAPRPARKPLLLRLRWSPAEMHKARAVASARRQGPAGLKGLKILRDLGPTEGYVAELVESRSS